MSENPLRIVITEKIFLGFWEDFEDMFPGSAQKD